MLFDKIKKANLLAVSIAWRDMAWNSANETLRQLDASNYINEKAQDITIIHENDNIRFQLQHEEKKTGKSDKGLRCQGSVDVDLVLHL